MPTMYTEYGVVELAIRVTRLFAEKEEEDDEIAILPFSVPLAYGVYKPL